MKRVRDNFAPTSYLGVCKFTIIGVNLAVPATEALPVTFDELPDVVLSVFELLIAMPVNFSILELADCKVTSL